MVDSDTVDLLVDSDADRIDTSTTALALCMCHLLYVVEVCFLHLLDH